MTPARSASLTLALLLLVAPARAGAIDDDRDEREARALYEQGNRLYAVGELDRAIEHFKEAYRRSPEPELLFNIAQAYRAKRDTRRALFFYESFLRAAPDSAERAFVEARVAELRALPPEPPPGRDDTGAGLRTAGAITVGAGALLAVAGLVFAVQGFGALDEVAGGADPSEGKTALTRAVVFGGCGTVAMAAGAVMIHVGSRPVAVQPTVGAGGAGLTVLTRF